MQLPVQQYPILTSGQMNPFHQALQTGLANYQNNLKTAYMPATMEADIATKQAYAQNYGNQMISQILSNPAAVARMNDDQINGLLNQFKAPGQSQQPHESFFTRMINKVTGSPNGATYSQPDTGNAGNTGNTGNSENTQIQPTGTEFGAVNPTSQGEITQIANQGNGSTGQINIPEQIRNRAKLQLTGNVMTGGGKGVGEGTTYIDPQTGNPYSSATTANVTSAQASILATERVAPYLKQMITDYKNSFGFTNDLKRGVETIGSYFTGGNYKTPHIQAKSGLLSNAKSASEGLIRDFNLNATGGNREALEQIVQPGIGESPSSYAQRMTWLYNTFKSRDKAGREELIKGIKLNPDAVTNNEGRQQLENTSAVSDQMNNEKNNYPRGSGEGQEPPEGSIFMFDRNGNKKIVLKSRRQEAIDNSGYVDVG